MNKPTEGSIFGAGLTLGFIIGICGGLLIVNLEIRSWRAETIKHGAARYNPSSGSFEWIESENSYGIKLKGEKE